MRPPQRPLQLLDSFLLLLVGPRCRASARQRRQCRLLGFILPAVIQRRRDLVVAASLGYVAALHPFHHDGILLLSASLYGFSWHLASWRRPQIITDCRVQFYRGALHHYAAGRLNLTGHY